MQDVVRAFFIPSNPDQIILTPHTWSGPLAKHDGTPFNPCSDVRIYNAGVAMSPSSFSWDEGIGAYRVFLRESMDLSESIQVIHHSPSSPFLGRDGGVSRPIGGFAVLASALPTSSAVVVILGDVDPTSVSSNSEIGADGLVHVTLLGESTVYTITPSGVMSVLANVTPYVSRLTSTSRDGVVLVAQDYNWGGSYPSTAIRSITPQGVVTSSPVIDGAFAAYIASCVVFSHREDEATLVITTYDGTVAGGDSTEVYTLIPGTDNVPMAYMPAKYGACNNTGDIYFSGSQGTAIQRVGPGGTYPVFVGSLSEAGDEDGSGEEARFTSIRAMCFDPSGNLYVCDANAIRKVTPEGVVTLFSGSVGTPGNAGGTLLDARYSAPIGICYTGDGRLVVADAGNRAIRALTLS